MRRKSILLAELFTINTRQKEIVHRVFVLKKSEEVHGLRRTNVALLGPVTTSENDPCAFGVYVETTTVIVKAEGKFSPNLKFQLMDDISSFCKRRFADGFVALKLY